MAAIGEVELLRLDRQHFEASVGQHTPAALNLLSVAARRLRRSDDFIRRTVTRNVNDAAAEQQTMLTRLADPVPALTGSPAALALHVAFFGVWIAINVSLIRNMRAIDPYPLEFMSVIISVEAIFLTLFRPHQPESRAGGHRIRSDIEFDSAMNTEVKIAYLHEEIDKLTEGHYELLVNKQKVLEKIR